MKADAQLQADVIAELEGNPGIDAVHVVVEVKCGIVSLFGEVASMAEKLDVERVTQAVSGVMGISDDIFVMQPGLSHRSDAEIELAATDVLRWMSFAQSNPINVQAQSGWVSLTGTLDLEYQRRAALAAVSRLVGVKGVNDHILISAPPVVKTSSLAMLTSIAIAPSALLATPPLSGVA